MKLLRHLFAPGPASGRQYFDTVIEATLAKPCGRCRHLMDDHGVSYGPLASFRRDQCLTCPCPGFRHAPAQAARGVDRSVLNSPILGPEWLVGRPPR